MDLMGNLNTEMNHWLSSISVPVPLPSSISLHNPRSKGSPGQRSEERGNPVTGQKRSGAETFCGPISTVTQGKGQGTGSIEWGTPSVSTTSERTSGAFGSPERRRPTPTTGRSGGGIFGRRSWVVGTEVRTSSTCGWRRVITRTGTSTATEPLKHLRSLRESDRRWIFGTRFFGLIVVTFPRNR